MPMPMGQLDQCEAEEDDAGHDATDRREAHVNGHPLGGRVDQTPDAGTEANRADQSARGDRDGPVTLGQTAHSIGHTRSQERVASWPSSSVGPTPSSRAR